MGATAFIMAGFAGIPYFNIMIAAIMPALLYYFGVFLYVILAAKRLNIKSVLKPINTRELLLDAPLFFIPLAVLVYFLFNGYSLPYVGFWSIISVVVLGLLSNVRKDINLTWRTVLKDMIGGVRVGSEMAVVCALIAIIATCIKVSGLGIRLPIVINDISGGHLIAALFIALFASTLLGMGVPTPVAYILVAIGVVPALESMGVSLIQAHFFCFISAVFSHITPPIAVGALIASRIAIAQFWPTCWEAVKAGITAFLLPFFVIYVPMIVLRPGEDLLFQSTQIMAIVCGLFSLQVFLSNSCFSFLKVHERVIFLISALCSLVFIFVQTYYFFLTGTILLAIGLVRQFMARGVPAPD